MSFKQDLSIKHIKGEIATCAVNKGKDEKGISKPDASHKQEPQSRDLLANNR